jgi:hypothetical protein
MRAFGLISRENQQLSAAELASVRISNPERRKPPIRIANRENLVPQTATAEKYSRSRRFSEGVTRQFHAALSGPKE